MDTNILEILEELRTSWPSGACSLFIEIENYSGSCGRCGHAVEDHEYLLHLHEMEDDEGNIYMVFIEGWEGNC